MRKPGDSERPASAWREDPAPAVVPTDADVYRALFERDVNGVAYHEVVLDVEGRPIDYVFLRVNDAFERLTGLSRAAVIGRRVTEVLPGIERDPADWIGQYGRVALGADPIRFQQFSEVLQRWYEVAAFSPAKGYFAAVFSDITEHKRLEDSLREANRRKTEFLAILSHELRNPLAPVQNAVWLLGRVDPQGPQARRAREVLERQVTHLARIIDDLLDETRIARGRIVLQKTRLDLVDLVRRTVEDYRALFATREIAVVERRPERPVWLDADPTRLAQVVGNLLQNAAKFENAGGEVEVAVSGGPRDTAVIRVRDGGPGIAPEMLGRIFEPFIQGDEGLARSRGGLGLGLSLVKGLVELHGGTVEARSDGTGRGAEFVVRLPGAIETPTPAAPPRATSSPGRRRVLVVEDNADAAETLRDVLLMWDHEVEIARDGAEGVEKARLFRPDVVLCDIGLPVMDGYGVARALRADPAFSDVLLVAVTGYAAPEDRRRAAEAGFDRHLGKPVPLELIEEVLEARRAR